MDRLACLNLPAFPLQLLLRSHSEWARYPVAVVSEDKPQGTILWVNKKAWNARVLPGLRYAAGSSLAPDLRAGVVPATNIQREVAALIKRLMRFTPEIEPSCEEPGVFLLSGTGLKLLYPSLEKWAREVRADVASQGFRANIVVGFTRFGTYAVAKIRGGVAIFENFSDERAAAGKVPIAYLDLDPELRDALIKLGIETIDQFLSLPPGGLYERFGPKANRLHRIASGDLWAPLQPCAPEEAVQQRLLLDDAETDSGRLLFLIRRLIHPMLVSLSNRREALAELWLHFLILRDWLKERIRPAVPTLDSVQLVDLIRLRLERMEFSTGVDEIELIAKGSPTTVEQLRLFTEQAARDLDAANRALARLRAEFGDEAVVHARLANGHLPEARFAWEPLSRVKLPKDDLNDLNDLNVSNGPAALVRRILAKPIPLPPQPMTHKDGWLLLGPKHGAVEKLSGPYIISGGWWNREIHRDYYFAETRRGDILWVYYDRLRRRWFLQGWVE
ncbi:MAG: DNA polymerase Y family protein [Deltaproteobacteria bacterium]|nr:DNA polymerase Y family protein [Deltaproteobacteria bacterium]